MTSLPGKTYYAILGVDRNASQDQIERSYADLVQTFNELPDGPLRRQRLEALEEAYLLLSNPIRRSVYDASLVAGQAPMMEIGMTVPGRVPGALPPAPERRSRMPLYFGLGLLTVFVVGYLGLAYSQQRMLRDVQERALQSAEQVQERVARQEQEMLEAEQAATGNNAEARERYAREAEQRAAEREARQRNAEFERWNAEVGAREQRAAREAQRAAEQRERELANEARRADQQEARDAQVARERADRERRQLLAKLITERRYAEAKQIVKDESELRQVEQAERYGR
ncbi:DnaJ domain-containing protein [Chitinimonas lacunae]|uniref:DnaJ domain-containing protein n=1 Tax=Chitinimonas lacunae TaxID=1963018 RepID=A0ABV8MU90_9NEIS